MAKCRCGRPARHESGSYHSCPECGGNAETCTCEPLARARKAAKPSSMIKPETDDDSNPIVTLPAPSDPMAVARILITDYQAEGHRTLRRWRGGWMRWDTSRWAEIEETIVRGWLYTSLEHASYLDKAAKPPGPRKWEPNRHKISDVTDALTAITHLAEDISPPAWLAGSGDHLPAGEIVACSNGLLHVGTRKLSAHSPLFFNTTAVPFEHDPAAPSPERWLKFLAELWPDDPDAISALQEFFGYVLSGRTDLHKILLLVGPTRSGKGTIGRVLGALVGSGNVAGPTLASLGTNFGLSPLLGKPLAVISDARLGGPNVHQVVERLLSISGEDTLTVDRKFKEPWTGKLPGRFVILSNELPRFGDASGAISHRFIVLTMASSFLGKENTHLTGQLLGELPGILSWALDGLDRLTKAGALTEPSSSAEAVTALQDLVSPVSAFVRDNCERGGEVPVKDLFTAWQEWCADNGHRPGSAQTFGRDLRAVIPALKMVRPRDDGDRERRYMGLSLTPARNGPDRGPPWTSDAPVRGGPRDNPLRAGVCEDCGEAHSRYGDGGRPCRTLPPDSWPEGTIGGDAQ